MSDMILLPDSQDSNDGLSQLEHEMLDWNEDGEDKWSLDSFINNNNNNSYYSSFSRIVNDIDLFTIYINDYVHIFNIIGKITEMWETKDKQKLGNFELYFNPRQTKQKEKPYHGKKEIIQSNIKVKLPLKHIQGPCIVECFNDFIKRNDFPDNAYYYNLNEICKLEDSSKIFNENDFNNFNFDIIHVYQLIKNNKDNNNDIYNNNNDINEEQEIILPKPLDIKPQTIKTNSLKKSIKLSPSRRIILDSQDEYNEYDDDNSDNNDNNDIEVNSFDSPIVKQESKETIKTLDDLYTKIQKMNLKTLQNECSKYGLPNGGNKTDLISRLFAANKAHIIASQKYTDKDKTKFKANINSIIPSFGPKKTKSISPQDKYKRVKINEISNDINHLEDLTCIEKLERGMSMRSIGFTSDSKFKLGSSVKIMGDIEKKECLLAYQKVEERLSPLKPKSKQNKNTLREKTKKLDLNILPSTPKSPKKESNFGNFVDLSTVQQRERRSVSSINLQEEIEISSDDDEEDDNLTFDSSLLKDPPKPLSRLKKSSREVNQNKPQNQSIYPSLDDFEDENSISNDSNEDNNESNIGNKRKKVRILDFSGDNDTDTLDDFIVDDSKEPPLKKQKLSNNEDSSTNDNENDIIYPSEIPNVIQHLSTRQAFSVYLQYLVSSILDDSFIEQLNSDTDSIAYFEPARKKIEHAIVDKRDLIVTSSVWGEEFSNHLKNYPFYESNRSLTAMDCQACRRSNHTSTFTAKLSGIPYDSQRLWETKSTTIKTFSNESKTHSYDLGRHCHQRTWLFHRLHHFKYKLLNTLINHIKPLQNKGISDVNILQNILDNLDFVNNLYIKLQQLLEEADEFGRKGTQTHPTL